MRQELESPQREEFEKHMEKKLAEHVAVEVPVDTLKQQQFVFSFDTYMEIAMLYTDELTKAIALSCVPPEIIQIQDQVSQI